MNENNDPENKNDDEKKPEDANVLIAALIVLPAILIPAGFSSGSMGLLVPSCDSGGFQRVLLQHRSELQMGKNGGWKRIVIGWFDLFISRFLCRDFLLWLRR